MVLEHLLEDGEHITKKVRIYMNLLDGGLVLLINMSITGTFIFIVHYLIISPVLVMEAALNFAASV